MNFLTKPNGNENADNSELKAKLKAAILSVPFPGKLKEYLGDNNKDDFEEDVADRFIDSLFSIFELNEQIARSKFRLPLVKMNPRTILIHLIEAIKVTFTGTFYNEIVHEQYSLVDGKRGGLAESEGFLDWFNQIEKAFVESLPSSSQEEYARYRNNVTKENIILAVKTTFIERNLPGYGDTLPGNSGS